MTTSDDIVQRVNTLAAQYIQDHPGVTLFLNPAMKVAEDGGNDAAIVAAFVESDVKFPKATRQ